MNAENITLPEISDRRLDEIEAAVLAQIAEERRKSDAGAVNDLERARARAVRRGRIWMGLAGAAAFIAVAAIIAPHLGTVTGAGSSSTIGEPATTVGAADQPLQGVSSGVGGISGGSVVSGEGIATDGSKGTTDSQPSAVGDTADREIVATANASVVVSDAHTAVQAITDAATAAGGYVESMSVGGTAPVPIDTMGAVAPDQPVPSPVVGSTAWISVRVPADKLTDALAGLSAIGDVTSSQVDRRDVTTEAVDLRARVGALEASVARLTALMGQSATTADLIAAESALADRQSELDSLRQQLTYLENQVGMSTLTVNLSEPTEAVSADPAGFGDGLAAGWNGLVASLNGIVIAIGFLLPWALVAAVIVAIVWAIRRATKRRKAASTRKDESGPEDA